MGECSVRRIRAILALAALLPAAAACGGGDGGSTTASWGPPMSQVLAPLHKRFDRYPQYSIVLNDMKEEDSGGTSYFHEYRVVYTDTAAGKTTVRDSVTPWQQVAESDYLRYDRNLGMTIFSKRGAERDTVAAPAGYEYVGNPQYGQWRSDSNGNSFWEFYVQYAVLRTLLGGGPIFDLDYDDYRKHRRRYGSSVPYYGRSSQYGTYGTYTTRSRPAFYERRAALESSRRATFNSRVESRAGRSGMSGVRSRSGGFGGK